MSPVENFSAPPDDGRDVYPRSSVFPCGVLVWIGTSFLISSFVQQTFFVYVRLETGSRLLSQG